MPSPNFQTDKYSAMSVWDLYNVMTTTVAAKQIFNLTCMAAAADTPTFDWAENIEKLFDVELLAMSSSLASRLNLEADDEDVREMAFKRVDGFVPAFVYDQMHCRKAVS